VAGRVALVVSAFPKISETFIVNKFLGLLERGWDVHVVCNRSEARDLAAFPQLAANDEVWKRVHVVWPHEPAWKVVLLAPLALLRCVLVAPRRTWRYLRKGSERFGLGALLRRLYLDAELVALGPEIVHFEFGALAPARMYLRDLLGGKVTVSFRGYDLNFVGLDQPALYEPVWSGADGLHFLGEDLWRRAQRRGCPADRFHVLIPPAIDASYFAPRAHEDAEPRRPLRILSVGRLEWKKGYEDAMLAIRRLVDRGVACEYRIVGDGEYLGAVAFARFRLKLQDHVDLLGSRPRADVVEEMERADVFLHSAVSEGFCNAVMEAQAMELPVVCTDADGLPENVADAETGFVVSRRDPAALADKLEILSRDPALRRRMGKAGRKRVLEKFRLADQVDRFESFYRQVRDGARPGAPRDEMAELRRAAVAGTAP
jgi:colanic acid/amylovoran biosynthesis glycosyltransferase